MDLPTRTCTCACTCLDPLLLRCHEGGRLRSQEKEEREKWLQKLPNLNPNLNPNPNPNPAPNPTLNRNTNTNLRARTHSLAAALRRMGCCRCTAPRPTRRRRRWWRRCWRHTRRRPRRRTRCARHARTPFLTGRAAPRVCMRALTRPPPRCAGWEAAAALCRGEAGVGGGGGGAAGGVPGGGQGEGQGAPASPAHPSSQAAPRRVSACALSLSRRRAVQDGMLPLQLALRNGYSIEVVAALLAAHPQAEDEVDSAEHSAVLERAKAHGQLLAGVGRATLQVGWMYTNSLLLTTIYLLPSKRAQDVQAVSGK
jgi:hypothetical protein